MSLVMRKIDGKMRLFKKTVKKVEEKDEKKDEKVENKEEKGEKHEKEEKGEVHHGAKEEKAEEKEHKEHPEFSKKTTDQIAHDHIKKGKGGGDGDNMTYKKIGKGCGKGGGSGDPGSPPEDEREHWGNEPYKARDKYYHHEESENRKKDWEHHEHKDPAKKQIHEIVDKDFGKGGGKKSKKLSFAAYSAKKWEKK
jgi:hypothetical protein